MRISRLVVAAVSLAASTYALTAEASPVPLPFTYTVDTLEKGGLEVETYTDLTPVAAQSASSGAKVEYLASQFQTEFEYGITDSLELGLYVAFQPQPNRDVYQNTARLTEGTGFKERLRYRLADAGAWPIDVGLYGEIVEYDTEFEIEAKIILERRFGNLRIAANAWAEREYEYATGVWDWVLNPTGGLTYQITPSFHLGAEYWMRAEYPGNSPARTFSLGPNQFVGPTVMFNFGKLWWSTGVYARIDDMGRSPQPGDNYGPVWVRTVIGLEL